jgi:hypothetical protein
MASPSHIDCYMMKPAGKKAAEARHGLLSGSRLVGRPGLGVAGLGPVSRPAYNLHAGRAQIKAVYYPIPSSCAPAILNAASPSPMATPTHHTAPHP